MKVFGPLLDIGTGEPIEALDEGGAAAEEEKMFPNRIAKESTELAELIGQRAREKGIPYRQALDEIRREFPDLCERAHSAVVGLKIKQSGIGRGDRRFVIHDYESDPAVIISNLAKEVAASENISFRAALSEVARKHPDLIRRYHKSTLGSDI